MAGRRLAALGVGLILTACGGAGSSQATGGTGTGGTSTAGAEIDALQGPLSFTPAAAFADLSPLSDGGLDLSTVEIVFASASRDCAELSNTPDSGYLLILSIATGFANISTVPTITYPIDDMSCEDGAQFCALLELDGPTGQLAGGVDGNIVLTNAPRAGITQPDGLEYAGSFSATVALEDGGQSMLSGSFDTTKICTQPFPQP